MTQSRHGFRLKPIGHDVVQHRHERRGFVHVPLDPHDPRSGRIDVFYRLLPRYGVPVDQDDSPIVAVINGGPGIPSSFYRSLDFDYERAATGEPQGGGLDRFKYLLKTHRVLLMDQRGTDGHSAPVDMNDESLDPNAVARLFSADAHARDTLAVIEHVVPADTPFYVIAQSYGGLPGMHYLALPDVRRPRGIVFSSSALPFEDPVESMRHRRREQLRLNLHLRGVYPDVEVRLAKTRAHLVSLGLDAALIHGLYVHLGKDVVGVWEPAFVRRLEAMNGQGKDEITLAMEAAGETPSLLNYILSAANFSEGHTDRTLAALGSAEIPFEPWMIDEHVLLMRTGQDGSWRQALVERMDDAPPPFVHTPSLDRLREAITKNQVLFTAADNDAFVPRGAYEAAVAQFMVEGHTELRFLPGGHHAIFLEAGYEAFIDWSAGLPE